MENSIGPVHDLSGSAPGVMANPKIAYAHGHRQKSRDDKVNLSMPALVWSGNPKVKI